MVRGGEKLKQVWARATVVAIILGPLAVTADNRSAISVPRNPNVDQPITVTQPLRSSGKSREALSPKTPKKIRLPFLQPIPPKTETLSSTPPDTSPHPSKEDLKLRDWVAKSLPTNELAALTVSTEVQDQFPVGLFVVVPGTNCGAVTQILPYDNGNKVWLQNYIFGRPGVITNLADLTGPKMYSGLIGHGDTDAAVALQGEWFKIEDRNIVKVDAAIVALTKTVCDQMPK